MRKKLVLKEPYLGEPVYNEDFDEVLGKFVTEVRMEGQIEYCTQAYFRIECKRNITLADKKGCLFQKFEFCFKFSSETKC